MSTKDNGEKKRSRARAEAGGTWYRLQDASRESLFSVQHLRRQIKAGRLRAFKAPGGREWRIRRDDLAIWLSGGGQPAA